MSKYTTEVRFICEHSAGLAESVGYNSVDSVLDASREKVFDFDYPIFDEAYRTTLEKKILKHYYTREICCETVGLWKLFLNRKMNEIMPYYNQLYKSALIEFNPMYDVDLTTTHQRVNNGENESNKAINENTKYNESDNYEENRAINNNTQTLDVTHSKTENESANKNDHWEYFSDTPEGGITGVEDMTYLTNATHITDDGDGSTSGSETDSRTNTTTDANINGATTSDRNKNGNNAKDINENNSETIKNIEDYMEHVVGKRGSISYSKMLEEFRKTFLNIDMLVINDLRDLFLNLW